jgi:hypothetical protein
MLLNVQSGIEVTFDSNRPKAAVHASSRRCGATFPKRTFEQVRSILLRSMTAMRTRTKPLSRQWCLLRVFCADFSRVHFEI